jgi:hypothetical protein
MRMTSKVFAEWLAPQITSGAEVIAGRLPEVPSRVIAIEMAPGAGLMMDGMFDVVSFQISCRGAENNLSDAEEIAIEVDNIMIGGTSQSTENVTISIGTDGIGVYVSGMGRSGGGPSQERISDAESRWVFTCNYYVIASTNVGLVT